MLDNIYTITLFLIIISCSIMTYSSIIFKGDTSLNKTMAATSALIPAIILGSILTDKSFYTFFFSALLAMHFSLLLFSNNTKRNILAFALIFASVLSLIPMSTNHETFTIERILMTISIIVNVIILIRTDRIDHKNKRNVLTLILLSSIPCLLISENIASILFAILFALIAWFTITDSLAKEAADFHALENKLNVLENEFNDELRKAVNRHTFHLKEVQEKMSQINKIDNLTKAYNKKAIFNIMEELIQDRKINGYSIIMFDLDNFKTLNDELGHVQGDMCLKTLSKIAHDSIRGTDYLGRYGGDEFLMVLPKAKLNTAITIAERFRKNIDSQTKPHFTVSVGLASFPDDGKTIKELLAVADKGLYLSKEKGRNAVSYHNPQLNKKF